MHNVSVCVRSFHDNIDLHVMNVRVTFKEGLAQVLPSICNTFKLTKTGCVPRKSLLKSVRDE